MINDDFYWVKLIFLMVNNDFLVSMKPDLLWNLSECLQGTLTTDADSLKAYEGFHSLLSNNLELKKFIVPL